MKRLLSLYKKIRIKISTQKGFLRILQREGMIIGDNCDISKSIIIGDEPYLIKIGNNVRLTHNVQLITHDGGAWTLRKMGLIGKEDVLYNRIIIDDNCNIGWNSVILPGVHIGSNSVIAANCVVTKSVPSNSVVAGVPGRVIESIEEYYLKHINQYVPTFSMSKKEKRKYLLMYKSELFSD